MSRKVRALVSSDYDKWLPLWQGYQEFYEADLSAVTQNTFGRLVSEAENTPSGLVVENDAGELLGLAHYLFHATTWSPKSRCYLNDLFTVSNARGLGVGRSLIEATAQIARNADSDQLYWLTHELNLDGRRLYDKVASFTQFVKYKF
ncbi:MAG: GNAT family N-acetyltransferase [Rhizobiales bacterium]|nr:GNAT family N-acetyltransferase [Hyphomicrobiales bacterium]